MNNSNFSFRPKILRASINAIIIAKTRKPQKRRFQFVASPLFVAVPLLLQRLLPILQTILQIIIMATIIRKTKRESLSPWTLSLKCKCPSRKSRFVKSRVVNPGRVSDFGQTLLGLLLLQTPLFATERTRAMFEHG